MVCHHHHLQSQHLHQWLISLFLLPGENARRRDPRKFHYSCVSCPDFIKGACRRGDMCEYAHGVFECWLHPAQHRTRLCKDGTSCNRWICFFVHTAEELRPFGCSSKVDDPTEKLVLIIPKLIWAEPNPRNDTVFKNVKMLLPPVSKLLHLQTQPLFSFSRPFSIQIAMI
ncbi:hypothetical protein QYF36_013547 [Acer negundo]|nr:hypothetical protein QYF36_013547 [Acer negundo]